MKGKLIIKNVGPIKDVTIDLNKINVIIGKQGSGKSTIAKLISYFAWVEKEICTKFNVDFFCKGTNFYDKLVTFHKMEGYFSENSSMSYSSGFIHISYIFNKEPIISIRKNKFYVRVKISYIPAERNIVAAIPNWFEVKLPDNNILSFMKDWETARKLRTKDNVIAIPNSQIQYYYDDYAGDLIKLNKKTKIQLTNSASGFQSSIPMIAVTDYVTNAIYSEDNAENIMLLSRKNNIIIELLKKKFKGEKAEDIISKINQTFDESDVAQPNLYFMEFVSASRIADLLTVTRRSKVIIEEPEQNLFPETQKDVLYMLIKSALNERVNMTITTHSPYILYAINNCIMGGLVKDNIPDEVSEKLPSKPNWIDPTSVSIWQINDKGGLESVQNEKTNTLKGQYLNDSMKEVMNEYFTMLKYVK